VACADNKAPGVSREIVYRLTGCSTIPIPVLTHGAVGRYPPYRTGSVESKTYRRGQKKACRMMRTRENDEARARDGRG